MKSKDHLVKLSDDYSSMREVWLTKKFLDCVSQICNECIDADNAQLNHMIRMSIDMSDRQLTEYVTDEIQAATFGIGNQLTFYFIVNEKDIGKGEEACKIRQYSFLAAIPDDVQVRRDSNTKTAKRLKRASALAMLSATAYRVYVALKEAVI